LKKIPDSLTFEDAIFAGDILSTGLTGVLRGKVTYGDTVAVFGAGPVGLCAVALSNLFGASKVIAVDRLDYRLAVASAFGALTVCAATEDPEQAIRSLTNGRGVDVGIEAAGLEATFNSCLHSVRRGGRLSIVGFFSDPTYFNISERFFDVFNLTIGLGDSGHMEELLNLIAGGKLDVKPLITHTFSLEDAMQGYDVFERKLYKCIKVILKP
jgi:alcohol dehydrogenase